ncbi:hypothetical protein BGZ95_004795 [Linnemannia exigua]|uniref:Crinkler effector protein N-terminal domain-containing protein n=1 Tax=Linnemannia exigua TaxID=604196 RepID=A0AAD4H2W8_9FUNG|nr:hypothetical protein BGZ95_004795 [Linnemannia exigua]
MLHNTITNNPLTLLCLVDGEATSQVFPLTIPSSETVGELRKLIKAENAVDFTDVDAKNLTLWRVSIPIIEDNDELPVLLNNVPDKERKKLGPATRLSKVFPEDLPEDTVHVIIQRPPSVPAHVPAPLSGYLSDGSRPGTPLSGDLCIDIMKIADKFFATGSKHADVLNSYVQGNYSLPTTTSGVRGLPKVVRRGTVDTLDSGPSLLFLDLPHPPLSTGDAVPERFRSNILLSVLEGMQAQDLPVFGVSGCGKTRSMIDVLCLQWGFYFNASKNDLGSDDLYRLADFVDDKTSENTVSANTLFAKNMTLLLFLSRLLILNYCLRVPGCRQTFSSARWALLQVCPNMFKDVFLGLFRKLYDQMKERTNLGSVLASIVRDEFVSVRETLAAHDYPNFSSESKLRLVVNEAQILSDKSPTSFESSSTQSNLRPMYVKY